MKEILAIVEDSAGNVIALHTAAGDVPMDKADQCPRARFEATAAELVAKHGGDARPFARATPAAPPDSKLLAPDS